VSVSSGDTRERASTGSVIMLENGVWERFKTGVCDGERGIVTVERSAGDGSGEGNEEEEEE
jgi:hypothetical protein